MTGGKELVRKAVRFGNPERFPVSNPYDLSRSDIMNVEVIRNYMGPDKRHSEWGFEWSHLDNDLTMGQPKAAVIKSREDLLNYRAPDPDDPTRFDATRAARAEHGEAMYYKANFVLSGFATMSFLRGFAEIMEDLYLDRDLVEELADLVFGFEESLFGHIAKQGFSAIGLADDWGSQENLLISPALWREVFKPRYRRQVELAHGLGLDVYFHCCGYIYDIIPDLIEIGIDILNPGQPNINGIERMGKDFSGKICFACPVSYQTTGISGTREEIRREVRQLAECLGNRGGGLIGLIPTDIIGLGAKRENIDYMLEAFTEFGSNVGELRVTRERQES
jgi:uroporphyrinogen-III decarboxylase